MRTYIFFDIQTETLDIHCHAITISVSQTNPFIFVSAFNEILELLLLFAVLVETESGPERALTRSAA